jgi:hypothetical protein
MGLFDKNDQPDPNLGGDEGLPPGGPASTEDTNKAGLNDLNPGGFDPNTAQEGSDVAGSAELQDQGRNSAPAPTAPASKQATERVPDLAPDGNIRDALSGDLSLTEEQLDVKRKLAAQPKVMVFIPLEAGETPGAYRPVIINTYRFEVKKGVMVEAPKAVAQLLMDALAIESSVLNQHETNLNRADGETSRALNA